jgi:hypothetical protein
MLTLFITTGRMSWRKFVSELTDPYRPELHDMRGPGPKHQAKNGAEARLARLPHPDRRRADYNQRQQKQAASIGHCAQG